MVEGPVEPTERKAVVFGGYPDFVHLRDKYNAEEEPDAGGEDATAELANQSRAQLEGNFVQLRLQYQALLHLVREHFRPDAATSRVPPRAPVLLAEHTVRRCGSEEMRALVSASGGWNHVREPVVFRPQAFAQPFTSRARILGPGFRRDFPTATVLGDALAAQFGPDWLAEGQSFDECTAEHCFSQVQGRGLEDGPLRELWEALPEWLRCPMVVMSTGPGGSGVAFHKHSSAWLLVLEGTKHWWLYPPGGPPTPEAYRALSLCRAAEIADEVAKLPAADRPTEVTLRAGEALFVPALWWHATYNVGPTLGVGAQYHVFDLDFSKAVREHGDSAFVLYHYGCEIHKSDPTAAAGYFEEAIRREPQNFYYSMNQLRFYLNLVWPPKQTLEVIQRLLRTLREGLDPKRQMLVLRFVVPSLFDFVEWNMGHDRLVKYSSKGCREGFESMLAVTRPYLPGGSEASFTSSLPHVEQLRYVSTCAQCGEKARIGRPGDPNTIWSHKFYCLPCLEVKEQAVCNNCGSASCKGQMGHAGTPYARCWYCAPCWKGWMDDVRGGKETEIVEPMVHTYPARSSVAPTDKPRTTSKIHHIEPSSWDIVD